jgi:uncharacterized protein with HEPN domain
MQRDILLLTEMIDAAEQAQHLVIDVSVSQLETNRERREALLWNFTVLGEASSRVSDEIKARFPDVAWQQPVRLRNRIVHGYWSIDLGVLHTTASEQLPDFAGEPDSSAVRGHPCLSRPGVAQLVTRQESRSLATCA